MTLSRKTAAPWMRKYGPMMAKSRDGQQLELRKRWSCDGFNIEIVRRAVAYIPKLGRSVCDTLRPLRWKHRWVQLRTRFSTRQLQRGQGRHHHEKPCRSSDNHRCGSMICNGEVSSKRTCSFYTFSFLRINFQRFHDKLEGQLDIL